MMAQACERTKTGQTRPGWRVRTEFTELVVPNLSRRPTASPTPDVGGFIMNAGTATEITEFDKWMIRDFWRHIKSRYGY